MIDAHIHLFQSNSGKYSMELIDSFVSQAQKKGLSEIYLLEHTHQFHEFKQMYKPIENYNEYQRNWLSGKMTASIESYAAFIEQIRGCCFPILVKFGLEACYIPETGTLLESIIKQYRWDFVVGSVHFIDNWGFDHKAEFWRGINVDGAYHRYYEIMLEMIHTGMFSGAAHPDSIKCFGHYPTFSLDDTYINLAAALNKAGMYAEHSGGLALNYGHGEKGMNTCMLKVFKEYGVKILTASDAHRPEHTGENIVDLSEMLQDGGKRFD